MGLGVRMLVHYDNTEVQFRVQELLGIAPDRLQRVLRIGAEARRGTTAFHPRPYAGYSMWAETTAGLRRELLVESGWKMDEDGGQPRTFNLARRLNVVVQSGDDMTGVLGERKPRSKHSKGSATATKVRDNQLALFPVVGLAAAEPEDGKNVEPVLETWVLLLAEVKDELRAELSRPIGFDSGGHVNDWHERIILNATPMVADDFTVEQDDRGDDEAEGFDVTWQSE